MRLFIILSSILLFLPAPLFAHEAESIKVVVVGDTGIGERAFHSGFEAVQNSMREENADAILHLGDFVYQPEKFPDSCPDKYIKEINETLVQPYAIRIFVAGDNDLEPKVWKPKASGCWDQIAQMATPFDTLAKNNSTSEKWEGVMHLGAALLVVLDVYEWSDPTPWLKP